jgi:membrane protease YdiL (CAAX protease family)
VSYFIVYIAYLFLFTRLENEYAHWLTLVALPAALLRWFQVQAQPSATWRELLASVGLSRDRLSRGVIWGVVIGLALGAIQIVVSRQRAEIGEIVASGRFFWAFPLGFLIMMITSGFTEEFFFRGVLQSSLRAWLRSKTGAVLISSVLFGLYHLPYAYCLTSWRSHGDLGAAMSEGVVPAMVVGLILGGVYERFKNLLAPVIVHSLFNAYWLSTRF